MEVEKDDYEFKGNIDHYFKDGILFPKYIYVGDNLEENNIIEVRFEDEINYVPVELARYIINYVLEASRRKGSFNDWAVNFLNGHTRDIRRLYHVKEIGRGYRLEMARR